jgi:hypothetical protein
MMSREFADHREAINTLPYLSFKQPVGEDKLNSPSMV